MRIYNILIISFIKPYVRFGCVSPKIDLLKGIEVKISDHAIVRYMERVMGVDISETKKHILSEEVLDHITKLGETGKYPNQNFRVVLKDYTVTTIITKH